ncbi:MAG: hypothetical protein K6A23_06425 [Butyrivibrio sp.]|nr:hypothetical protein [Butyrivibrio sp.]
MKREINLGTHVGASSILLIMMVLSLISFSTLAIVNAHADYNLTNNLAQRELNYYQAAHNANAWIASMDTANSSVSYKAFPISDIQNLEVTIEPEEDSKDFKNVKITQWQIITDTDVEYDNSLPVAN